MTEDWNSLKNLFPLTNGVSYNSWLILDEKTAIIDTVDDAITESVSGKHRTSHAGKRT